MDSLFDTFLGWVRLDRPRRSLAPIRPTSPTTESVRTCLTSAVGGVGNAVRRRNDDARNTGRSDGSITVRPARLDGFLRTLVGIAVAPLLFPGGACADGLDIVDLEEQPWYEASDRAVAREIASPRNSGARNMSIADIRIPPGVTVRPHHHDWEEVYYVTAGRGLMRVGDTTEELHAGQAVVIPPNAWHNIENLTDEDLRLIVVCAPPWRAEGLKYE